MPNLFTIIGESWGFCRKQPALMHVMLWLFIVPSIGLLLLEDTAERYESTTVAPELALLMILVLIVLTLIMSWGAVCVLSVGKRLLQAKSGRTRTSFKTVRSQAASMFVPFVLTHMLREIFTVLWSIALIIPGFIYSVRTTFYAVIVVCEGISYRAALQKSKDVVKGNFWRVFWSHLFLQCLTMVPAVVLSVIFAGIAMDAPFAIVLAASTATSIVFALATTINLLSLIQIYHHFRPSTSPIFR